MRKARGGLDLEALPLGFESRHAPLFFFDIADGEDLPDLDGSEWPDLAAARMEAVRYSAEVLKEMPERFWNCEAWKMTVSDADRVTLFTLKFLAESAGPSTASSLAGTTEIPA